MALNLKREVSAGEAHIRECIDQEHLFHLTFENAAVGIAHVGNDGSFIRVNNKLCAITGYSRDELVQKRFQEITHPDDLAQDLVMAEKLLRGNVESYSMEKRYFRKDGSIVWIKLTGSAVFHADGKLNVFIAVIEDISEQKELESSLRRSEDKYSKLFYSSTGFMLTTDILSGMIIEVNDSFCRMTGYLKEELIGQSLTALGILSQESRDKLLAEIMKNGRIALMEMDCTDRSGKIHNILYSAEIISLNGVSFILASGNDITLYKKAEEALRESEKQFRLAYTSARIGAFSRNFKTGESHWSTEFRAIFGLSPDAQLPLNDGIPDAVHPQDRPAVIEATKQHYQRTKGPEFNSDHRILLGDGQIRWVNIRAYTDFDSEGNPLQTYGIATDITDRKQVEERLIDNEARLQKELKWAILLHDLSGRLVDGGEVQELYDLMVDAAAAIMEAECASIQISAGEKENLGLRLVSWKGFHPESAKYWENVSVDFHSICSDVLVSQQRTIVNDISQSEALVGEGSFREFLRSGIKAVLSIPLISRSGNFVGVMSTHWRRVCQPPEENLRVFDMLARQVADLIERMRTEEKLREREKRLRLAVDAGKFGVFEWHVNSDTPYWENERMYEIFGLSPGDKTVNRERFTSEVIHPDDLVRFESDINESMLQGSFFNGIYRIRRQNDGQWRFIQYFGQFEFTPGGRPIRLVSLLEDVTGRKRSEDALKESEEKFRILANNMSQLAWMMDNEGRVFWYNQQWLNFTGRTMDEMQGRNWEKVIHQEHVERVIASLDDSMASGKLWEDLFPICSKEGEYRWFLTRAIPIKDETGKSIRWLGTNTDITHQRDIEKRLKTDNKLFEDLLYIAAHDLKGPVANMYGALDLMDRLPMEKKVMFLNQFRDLADRLNITIQGVTDILRMRNENKSAASEINLDQLLDNVVKEFDGQMVEVTIRRQFDKQVISYVEVFLYSIVKNLVSNSIKYRRETIPLQIEITTRSKNDFTLLSVTDNGSGINLDMYRERLFKPFERFTSGKIPGTGIGLYIIKDIIEKNGGYITVDSIPGKGTTFSCYLREY